MIAQEQPDWVCAPCGEAWASGRARSRFSTWHPDTCGVCGKKTSCTEPRDFGYLKPGWDEAMIAVLTTKHIQEILGE